VYDPNASSAIFLGGNGSGGPHGIVFDDDTAGAGVQLFWRTSPNQLILEDTSGGTGDNGTDLFIYDKDDDEFYFKGKVGIETTTPDETLHVVGMVKAQGDAGSGTVQISNNAGDNVWNLNAKTPANGGWKLRDASNNIDIFTVESNSSANSLYIDNAGEVGIMTNNPTRTLFVQGTIGCSDTHTGLTKGIYDIAEIIPIADEVEEGEVLVLDPTKVREVRESFKPYDPLIVGVVSSESDEARSRGIFFLGDKDEAEKLTGKKHAYMCVTGQVEVKVCLENGPIAQGDLLTSSSLPGHAMKAVDRDKAFGAIIGKALESFDGGAEGQDRGKIIILVTLQ